MALILCLFGLFRNCTMFTYVYIILHHMLELPRGMPYPGKWDSIMSGIAVEVTAITLGILRAAGQNVPNSSILFFHQLQCSKCAHFFPFGRIHETTSCMNLRKCRYIIEFGVKVYFKNDFFHISMKLNTDSSLYHFVISALKYTKSW